MGEGAAVLFFSTTSGGYTIKLAALWIPLRGEAFF
jgi:hypothetical protein